MLHFHASQIHPREAANVILLIKQLWKSQKFLKLKSVYLRAEFCILLSILPSEVHGLKFISLNLILGESPAEIVIDSLLVRFTFCGTRGQFWEIYFIDLVCIDFTGALMFILFHSSLAGYLCPKTLVHMKSCAATECFQLTLVPKASSQTWNFQFKQQIFMLFW